MASAEGSNNTTPADPREAALNCVDISDTDIANSVSLVKQACLDSGFFYIVNHGISQEFMDAVFQQSKSFFELPVHEKMKLVRNKYHRGYSPILDETLDPANSTTGDSKEGYYIGIEISENAVDHDKPFYGPNIWPSEDLLPGWRQTMDLYHQQALGVAKQVARLIALALDLDSDFFDKPEMLGEPIASVRLLHYEARKSDPKSGIYGAGAHTDYGLLTLLATDGVRGLQICKDKDTKPQIWEYVEPLKGCFIVNIGDMLERWSNCIFRSTLHRVLIDESERYSIAFFVEPSHNCLVECLPSCKSELNPPKFPPVKCASYLSQRYKETYGNSGAYNEKHNASPFV